MAIIRPCLQFGCLMCEADYTICTACQDSFILDSITARCKPCQNQVPANGPTPTLCLNCDSSCLACTIQTNQCAFCMDAVDKYLDIGNRRCTRCNAYDAATGSVYFKDLLKGKDVCVVCHPTCMTCNASDSKSCKSCIVG